MDLGGTSVSGPRPYNEDTFTHRDLSAYSRQLGGLKAFIMVSDGMGGHQSGDVASRIACETAESYVDDLLRMAADNQLSVEPALALQEIVAEANNAVLNAAAEAGGASMGATFVGAFVSDTRAWIGHVGDSRAYLLHRGVGTQLTTDHSQVGRLIAEGVLTEEQAQAHPQRNVIDRALGFSGAEAEVDLVDLELGDAIVLCSDGLSTVLGGEEIAAVCGLSKNAQAASASLAEEALKADTDDNATAVVYADDWSLFQSASPKAKESRRAMTAQRRAASRHNNAQRSTLYIAAALGVLALGLVAATMLTPPKGGSVGTPPTVSGGAAREVGPDAEASQGDSSSPSSGGDNRVPEYPKSMPVPEGVAGGVWVRLSRTVDRRADNEVAKLTPGSSLMIQGETGPTDSDFYAVQGKDLGPKNVRKRVKPVLPEQQYYVLKKSMDGADQQ